MLGQRTDAGNTTTLAGYARLLEAAFLLSPVPAYSGSAVRQRASSPKWVLWNNALVNAVATRSPAEVGSDPTWRGRLVENAVGAHLLNHLPPLNYTVTYWRQASHEVDFVVTAGSNSWAIEVKSGRAGKTGGIQAYRRRHPEARPLVVGGGGLPLDEFFLSSPEELLVAG
jgi:predicted AAA+ superfamily ATPase